MNFDESDFDTRGFMAIDLTTGEVTYCRNSQDAVDQKLSGGCHIYSTAGKDYGNGNCSWRNPLTGEIDHVHYDVPTKGTSLLKSIFTRKK